MQEEPRTAPARDVPRPRPVVDAADDSGSPLARAARSVADAVGGLLADRPGGEEPAGKGGRAGAVLRDVVGAVASAARAGRGTGRTTPSAPPQVTRTAAAGGGRGPC